MKSRRSKGTGCVFRRGKYWYMKWVQDGIPTVQSTGIPIDGESQTERRRNRKAAEEMLMELTEPLRIKNREDAIALMLRRMQTAEERLKDATEKVIGKTSVDELVGMFQDSARRPDCSPKMLKYYCACIKRLAEYVGEGTPIRNITNETAEDFSREVMKTLSPNTHNKIINALDLTWRTCGESAGLEASVNPWAGISRRKLDTHVRRVLSHEETDRILAAAEGELQTLIGVCLYTGLRLGDACRLKWEDVSTEAVFVKTHKRGKKVAIPLHPKLKEILAVARTRLGDGEKRGYVMPETANRYLIQGDASSGVSRSVKRLMERCDIQTSVKVNNKRMRPNAGAHSLRHTFVTRAIEAGIPPHIVQAIVGHSSAAMTEHYTHLSDKAVMSAFADIK